MKALTGELASPRFTVTENGLPTLSTSGRASPRRDLPRPARGAAADRLVASRRQDGPQRLRARGRLLGRRRGGGRRDDGIDLSKKYPVGAGRTSRPTATAPASTTSSTARPRVARRLGKKGRRFDLVVLDPPSFSTTKKGKAWSAARDLGSLVALGLGCLAEKGTLYVSTNQRGLAPRRFEELVASGFAEARRPGAPRARDAAARFQDGPGRASLPQNGVGELDSRHVNEGRDHRSRQGPAPERGGQLRGGALLERPAGALRAGERPQDHQADGARLRRGRVRQPGPPHRLRPPDAAPRQDDAPTSPRRRASRSRRSARSTSSASSSRRSASPSRRATSRRSSSSPARSRASSSTRRSSTARPTGSAAS